MLKQAKIKLKSLIYDDSGVAMAYTIMVFLFFFMLCVSTYAMTENIRQKMELQNACDAAAYSGAVVQADMLSRVAVLNRALAWTYLQTNRMEMDWLVEDNWLPHVKKQHRDSAEMVKNGFLPGCGAHTKTPPKGGNYYASYVKNSNPYVVKMRNKPEDENNLISENAIDKTQIEHAQDNMITIMNEINNIKSNMNLWIAAAIDNTWSEINIANANYKFLLNGTGNSAPTYFTDENCEENLLAFINAESGNMKAGVGDWWILPKTDVIQRIYKKGGLYHSWINYYDVWVCSQFSHINSGVPMEFNDAWNGSYEGKKIVATKITQDFFGKAGSIVVAAKRPLQNPFSAITIDTNSGLYAAFNSDDRDMWVVSAARAGVRFNKDPDGYYRVQWPGETAPQEHGYKNNVWNLCEEDWDAVMIPVARAWNNTVEPGVWGTDQDGNDTINADTNALLSAVKSALEGVNSTYGTDDKYVTPENPMRH